jgi:hypothetical protein
MEHPHPYDVPNLLRGVVVKAAQELPEEEKTAYLQAMRKCPQLIRSESDPYRFLQHENWKPDKAAELLARHWKLRLDLFGEERAFLPLKDLSGNGALNEQAIRIIASGFSAFLPNDVEGRTVLFVNHKGNRRGDGSRFRVMFYMLQKASEMGRPVVILRQEDDEMMMQKRGVTSLQALFHSFPFDFSRLIVAFILTSPAMRVCKEMKIPMYLHNLGDELRRDVHYLVCSSQQDLIQELRKLGFANESVPTCLGGTWSCDNLGSAKDHGHNVQKLQHDPRQAAAATTTEPDIMWDAEFMVTESREARKERKRKRDLAYSKNQRKRIKDEEHEVLNKHYNLTLERTLLEKENKRLERLVLAATSLQAAAIELELGA